MRKIITTLATSAALVFTATPAAAQTKWDLPAAYPVTNFHTQVLQQFVKDVDELSKGQFKITLHDSASLYKAPEIKRAVQGNQAQIGEILLVNFANEDPLFELDGLPFLISGYDTAWRLYQAQKPYLEKKLASQGMLLLYSVAWPAQGIYTNRDVNSTADMKGMKWRAYSPATARIAELVGAQPVTIQSAELSQAMATGVVDSFMTSGATGYDTKVYEYIKKFYDVQAWQPKNAVIVNKRAFDALDAASQQALLQAGAKAEKLGWDTSRERSAWYLGELEKNGLKVIKPSAQLMAGLNKIGETMIADWLKKAGADGQALLDAYRKP